jgi:hypothetical protein
VEQERGEGSAALTSDGCVFVEIVADLTSKLPHDNPHFVTIFRHMMIANMLSSYIRLHLTSIDDEHEDEHGSAIAEGDRLVMLLATAGILKEALDLFRSNTGIFEDAITSSRKNDDSNCTTVIQQRYERVCTASKKKEPGLYADLLAPLRHEAAFHVDCEATRVALQNYEARPLYDDIRLATKPLGHSQISRYPFADEIQALIAFRGHESGRIHKEQLRKSIIAIRDCVLNYLPLVSLLVEKHLQIFGYKEQQRISER